MADTIGDLAPDGSSSGGEIYVPSASTATRHVDGGGLVIDVETRLAGRLNSTGSLVWQVLGDDLTVAQLAEELAEAFGVTPDLIRADLQPMLQSLVATGFLEEISQAPRRQAPSPDALDDGPVRLTIPPCGCLTSVEDLDWVATSALRVGNAIFGVRTNDLGAHQVLAEALVAHAIDDPLAAGYYSVELSAEPTEAAPLRLWEGNTILCRTQSTAVLWERLHLSVSRHLLPAEGTVRLSMLTVVGPKGAALVPAHSVHTLYEQRDELAAAGILLADGPTDVDSTTGEVIVRTGVPVDESAVETFVSLLPGRARVPGASPQRVPVVAISCMPSDGDELSRLTAVADAVLPHVVDAPRLGGDVVFGLLEALAAGPEVAPAADANDVAGWLVDVVG